nr:PREDICTED: formin-like protein 7 isoform X4 [Equus przewalskii]
MRGARALPGAAAGGRGSPRPCCGPRAPGTTPRRLPRRRGRVAGRGAQALPLGAARRRHSGGRMWAPACFQRGVPAAPAPPGAGLSLPRSPFRRGDARRAPRFTSDMTATRSPPPPPCTGLACPDSGNPQRPLPRPRELRASKQKRRRSVTPSLPSNSPPTSHQLTNSSRELEDRLKMITIDKYHMRTKDGKYLLSLSFGHLKLTIARLQ